jgi:hypothetical protein
LAVWSKNGVSTVGGITVHTLTPFAPSSRSSCRRLALSTRTAAFDME